MRYMLLLSALFLVGCQTVVPVTQTFPEAPEILLRPCMELDMIPEDTVKFSEFLKTVTSNYKKYHSCSDKVLIWQEWYREQKSKFESIED